MKHIFIVDDDIHIGNMLEEVLQREGYKVSRAYSGTEALLVLSSQTPDLILLDLMLPGLNGEEVLPKIQGIPVIILSAKSETAHKVQLLLDGACDYITKPFDLTELLARITVQLRNASSQPILRHTLTFQEINLNTETHSVSVQDRPVKLTRTEYAILKLLMENPSQVITKSVLLDRISEDTPDCMESSLKVHISNLRKKLKASTDKDYIEAVWGIGFKMKED
ncbi:MAG: response regulator transcription factor [Lachnospiraceae bacterium]